jgi:fumarate reductase subunit C
MNRLLAVCFALVLSVAPSTLANGQNTGKASTALTVAWVLLIVALITLAFFLFQDPSFWNVFP